MKVCTIVGARPQFIKAATVSRIFATKPEVQEIMIHTGQHYDDNMSTQFFTELAIPFPQYHLNIGSGTHGHQTGAMLSAIEDVLMTEKPDWVLVYGDTNSTLAGALAAAKLHIPIAHVEAGLRSFNRAMPEEVNRVMTDHLSTRLFTPTPYADTQLLREGILPQHIIRSGDVMYDAILFYNEFNQSRTTLFDTLSLDDKSYVLVTIHRAENTDCIKRLTSICHTLKMLSQQYTVILPLHPRTKRILNDEGLLSMLEESIHLIPPVGYLDMLALESHASCIITDSGGVQKEAYFNAVPCITLRHETEWVELVEVGWNTLCAPDNAEQLLDLMPAFLASQKSPHTSLYGNGNAASVIVESLST